MPAKNVNTQSRTNFVWSGRGDSNSRSRASEARALNQTRPLPDLVATPRVERGPCGLQPHTLPSSSVALHLVDSARVELAFHGCRPWIIPLYELPTSLGWPVGVEPTRT